MKNKIYETFYKRVNNTAAGAFLIHSPLKYDAVKFTFCLMSDSDGYTKNSHGFTYCALIIGPHPSFPKRLWARWNNYSEHDEIWA